MKPNGLVAAASITSQTSRPSRSHMIATSLTRPMLTLRNVFSSSFTISAVCGGRHRDHACRWPCRRGRAPACVQAGRDAADDLGRVAGVELRVARVDALGREREEEVSPTLSPRSSSSGQDQLLGGAGIGGALEDDELPRPQALGDRLRGGQTMCEVGVLGLAERRRHADDHRVARRAGSSKSVVARELPARDERRQPLRGTSLM